MASIFISYTRVDRRFVDDLADKLRRIYGYDNVWFDEGLHGGDIWWEEILDQIAARDIFIYVLTNESVLSRYCQAEFTEARRLQRQIITVQARDRTRLTDELGDIHYVSMVDGVDDADALTELIRSINKRMTKVPKRRPKPLWEPRTPKPRPIVEKERPHDAPEVETPPLEVPRAERENAPAKPWWKKTEFVIGAVLIPIIVALIGILPSLLNLGGGNDPDLSPTTAVAQNLTDIFAGVPTLSGFQQVQTAEAMFTQAAQTQASFALTATEEGLHSVNATATAERIAATETAAYATLFALSITPTASLTYTPESPTSTPTPTLTLTVRPTNTPQPPTATFTPEPPTNTPPPSPEQMALTPQTSNANWQPYITEREFDGVTMVLVPAGCFQMGSTQYDDEKPIHEVCFEEPFWIDKYEVTNEQFAQFNGQAASASNWTGADRPREQITWTEANAFCASRGARLPTEAEWEYAARGPDGLVYPWGNEFVAENAVYGENSGSQTADVGSRPGGVSWVGALDLSGNVWEWVADWYGTYLSGHQVNPQGPASGDYRVLRGGSWDYDTRFLRASSRDWIHPVPWLSSIGFRCALSLE